MADTAKQREWQKKNTVMVGVRFQRSTDADIIEFLDGKRPQPEIKRILREYIAMQKEKEGESNT